MWPCWIGIGCRDRPSWPECCPDRSARSPLCPLDSIAAGEDVPFVNNYGVWVDEFESIGMAASLERIWPEAVCYFGEEQEVSSL